MLKNIARIAKERGYSLADVERGCKFGTRSIYGWDKSVPAVDKVQKVAAFLGCTVDDLLKEE